jgi:hypothetical protein
VLVEHGQEQLVLPGEVRVDGALRVARLLGDLLERRAVEAVTLEDAPGGRDQVGARALLALRARQARLLAYRRYCHTVGIRYRRYP